MTEKQEETCKALRRAWREFCDKVNKMGNVTLNGDAREEFKGDDIKAFAFVAYCRIAEDLRK